MAQTKKLSKIHLLLPLLWMAVIFMLSQQPASISSGQSGVFVEQLHHIAPSVDQQLLTFLVRKGAHIFAYFVLGILMFNALWRVDLSKFRFNRPAMLSIIICALYAASDEFHQLFIIGRSGELRDIMIDSCAAMVGVFIISIFVRILQKSKK
jgi:VanZ family protein